MPTKSPRISRPTHRTRTGRIVYDRPVHYFEIKDLVRCAKAVHITMDLDVLWDALQVLITVWFKIFEAYIELLPIYKVWGMLIDFVWSIITQLWGMLKSRSDPPENLEPRTLD